MLLKYHIGRIVLGSMYVGVSVWLGWSDIRVHGHHPNPTPPKLQHTSNQEQYDQCGISTE
jgi:hypothetical protein